MDMKEGVLVVKQPFHKFFVCTACGTPCYFCVTNKRESLHPPTACPYNISAEGYGDEVNPCWKECGNGIDNGGNDVGFW